MQTIYIKFGLNQLTCHHRPEGWTYSEPYLWNVFFKIDGSCVRINNQFFLEGKPVYHFSPGSHGNLHGKDMGSGESIAIPKEVGEWRTSLVPLHVPYFESGISGLIGVVSVLMEQNYVSSKGAEAGHNALNEGIRRFIDSVIVQFDPKRVDLNDINGSIKKFYEAQAAEFSQNIGNLVGQAVANAQSIVQNIFSLVNKDAVIGFQVFDFSNSSIMDAGGEVQFKHRWTTRKDGDWEIKGAIQGRKDPEMATVIKRKSREEEE
jgi:hypothetical protein